MNFATFTNLDGKQVTVKLGDVVCFKDDIEQRGKVVKIERSTWGGGYQLTLENEWGFSGEFIGGQTIAQVHSADTWTV